MFAPDHPWLHEHPDWFHRRPDGTLKYAENPPKKYQDIYPFDFASLRWSSLWEEVRSIFEFWIAQGVTSFKAYMHITPDELAAAVKAAPVAAKKAAPKKTAPKKSGGSDGGSQSGGTPGDRGTGSY